MQIRIVFILVVMFALVGTSSGHPDSVRISGHAPGYAGHDIVFHYHKDNITFTEEVFVTISVDSTESFSATAAAKDNPLYVFSNSGVHYLYMYVESGKHYQVVLPEKTPRTRWESLNPYFEGTPTHIAVLNHDDDELNNLISEFDGYYETLFGEPFLALTAQRDQQILDSVSLENERLFSGTGNDWFDDYRRYRMAFFRMMARVEASRGISDNYFRDAPVLYDNIAYMELFNQVYNNYFLFLARTARGKSIHDDINKFASYSRLMNTLQNDDVLGGDRLLEMVMLKGLHDSFYGSDFSRSALLRILDSLAVSTNYPEHAHIARNIREKTTRLMTGFRPPEINMKNREGVFVNLSDYHGEYVYLNFCTAASYSCLSEYDLLQRLDERFGEHFRIVTIFIAEEFEAMTGFLEKNDYNWDFLFYGDQPSVLKDYDIRMFPTCYFIGRDGKLLMSPAPLPSEDFERFLVRTLRSDGLIR